VAFDRIKSALQQRPKDGGLHIFPFGACGKAENVELVAVERERLDGFEEAPVGAEDMLPEDMLIEGWQNWDMLGMMEQIQGSHKAATYVGAPPHISAINAV
jgi:hypothetical protein